LSWNSFAIFWYFKYVHGKNSINNPIIIVPAIIGFILCYISLAKLINSTEILITNTKITVINGPIPWLGNFEFDVYKIRSVTIIKDICVESAQCFNYYLYLIDYNDESHCIAKNIELSNDAMTIKKTDL